MLKRDSNKARLLRPYSTGTNKKANNKEEKHALLCSLGVDMFVLWKCRDGG